jgi:pimeloyl-ACP methyl ester carboxylesterase
MADDTVTAFLNAPTEQRLRMAMDARHAADLTGYLGPEAYAEYLRLAERLDEDHLGVTTAKNLVFVPGVMGSTLQSRTKGGVWWVDVRTRKHIEDLRLAPDGETDADPDNDVGPGTTDPSYEPFLTAVLAQDDLGHVLFPYDWRKSLRHSAGRLRDLVARVFEENGGRPVHLVAHSMGGLMVRTALMLHGDELWPRVGRVVFVGTPHFGSPAIAGYLKNHLWGFELMAVLGLFLSRETFRSLWGVLGMLPAPRGIYPGTRPGDPAPWSGEGDDPYVHPCANFDLYRADDWRLGLDPTQTEQLQRVLDGAAAFHRDLHEAHDALDQEYRDRMLVIAGVGFKTLFRLAYDRRFFGLWERTAKVTSRVRDDPHREGDGRVPLASATLDNVRIRYVRGLHAGLTNIEAVYNDVFAWLRGADLGLPDRPDGALSGHLAPAEGRSEAPHLDDTAKADPFDDDPGLWELGPPDRARLEALTAALEEERLPEFNRVRLL